MSKDVFSATNNVDNNINRSSYDHNHNNSFSANIGQLFPLYSPLVPANSKLTIKPNVGLQFMPMLFPVQTPMRMRLSFFKVPLRILWSDYMDYVSNFRKDLEAPYHDIDDYHFNDFYGDCQLGDYLNIANVIYGGQYGTSPTLTFDDELFQGLRMQFSSGTWVYQNKPSFRIGSTYTQDYNNITLDEDFILNANMRYKVGDVKFMSNSKYTFTFNTISSLQVRNLPALYNDQEFKLKLQLVFCDSQNKIVDVISRDIENNDFIENYQYREGLIIVQQQPTVNFTIQTQPDTDYSDVTYVYYNLSFSTSVDNVATQQDIDSDYIDLQDQIFANVNPQFSNIINFLVEGSIPAGGYAFITPETSPFYSSESNPNGRKLRAFRARAYEAIYNAYYRDVRNNPFIVNGKEVYNRWLPSYDGGADSYPYKLHRANWEKDFLTTAVHSPQQGVMPLVGLTQYTDNIDDLSYKLALVDEDGKKYSVQYVVDENNNATVSVGDILPDSTSTQSVNYQELLNSTNLGFTIPDLRVVNAYQKYLELNMRKGYSYKDIIEGRFDCKVKFDELLMPEFIGGYTRDIQMNRVVSSIDANLLTNTAPEYAGTLGSLAGDAFLSANDAPTISVFCDEECIIMGILSVVPQPVYSQLMPKDYFYDDILDHFNPEFNNLGFQPIKYQEICPLQCEAFGVKLDDTFGYQRPWYEYVAMPDTAHGLMRSTNRNFIMNRHFGSVPKLNQDFLLINQDQLNNVFQVTDNTHKILGQCFFEIKAELPVSRVAIPRLD